MFEINGKAEISKINLRSENHGEESVRAIDVKCIFDGVPIEKLTSAIRGAEKLLYNKDQPLLQECYPLKVRHKIENCKVTFQISRKKIALDGADLKSVEVTPLPNRVAKVKLLVQFSDFKDGVIDALTAVLKDEATVSIVESQTDLEDAAAA